MNEAITIGELAKRSGLAASAIRFYEEQGLIGGTRTQGGQRQYQRETLRRVAFIRAAQAVGLLLFFPSFLLGAGGPPPHVMGSALRHVAGFLPLTWVTNAVREPWLALGTGSTSLALVAAVAVVGAVVAARRSAL